MSRVVRFYVEGPSEFAFVKKVLGPYLFQKGIIWDKPILAANKLNRNTTSRGGVTGYQVIKRDLRRIFGRKGDNYVITTMLDYYALPKDFPSADLVFQNFDSPCKKAKAIEQAWGEDMEEKRFVPNLILHEYETLVLTDPMALKKVYPDAGKALEELQDDIKGYSCPEDINDGKNTAPSKRIKRIFNKHGIEYDKVFAGAEVLHAIGLDKIRERCPKFDSWVRLLESLV